MLSVLVETKLLLTDDCTGTRGLTVETNCSMWSVQNLMTVLILEALLWKQIVLCGQFKIMI